MEEAGACLIHAAEQHSMGESIGLLLPAYKLDTAIPILLQCLNDS